jgi:hypothetical protein
MRFTSSGTQINLLNEKLNCFRDRFTVESEMTLLKASKILALITASVIVASSSTHSLTVSFSFAFKRLFLSPPRLRGVIEPVELKWEMIFLTVDRVKLRLSDISR